MIQGKYNLNAVYIDGKILDTTRSLKVRNHAPDGGVSWNYLGSGPSQLALALLLEFGATDQEALNWYQEYKKEVIAELPPTDFEMENQKVIDWLEARRLFAQFNFGLEGNQGGE